MAKAPVNKSVRCPVKRALKPPPSNSTHVESSKPRADVRYLLPANQPRVGTCIAPLSTRLLQETVRINTANVAQPFLDAGRPVFWP
ncbi:hypothetical protein E4U42_001065 [Claviceps africana]|uniref:Uncharacterized protein n=1 Tax=Claviceps africana TaxID=83212 RepID=A0A8K0JB13_9HYPO|nr:hypothetical protein E4U42_001065 [Claviceps africana]